jgi:hypothetical protein
VSVHLADERVASAELDYLAAALQPPCPLGEFTLTGHLARSATALLFTARGGVFGAADEGVLKLTGSAYAPILRRELALLHEAAQAEIDNVIRPLSAELVWLAVGGARADRPAAALPMPFLTGGDLGALAKRAGRAGHLGSTLALEAARPIAEALRGLLGELERPIVHGDVRSWNVLLPSPNAAVGELVLIDLDAAHELDPELRPRLAHGPLPTEAAAALAGDVRGFGEILALLASGVHTPPTTANRAFDSLVAACLSEGSDRYTSLVDSRLWHDLAEAEQVQARLAGGRRRVWLPGWLARMVRR